jgi:hypothetical protein
MSIKQLSIFLENKSGRLTEVLETLGQEQINIAAMSIADTSEYGILRLIVSDPLEALKLLKERDFSVNLTDVIGIETPVEAGSFARALKNFSSENISIEYMYAFSFHNKGVIVMRTDDRQKAFNIIEQKELKVVTLEEIFKDRK